MPMLPLSTVRWTAGELNAADAQGLDLDPVTGAQLSHELTEGLLTGPCTVRPTPFTEAIVSWEANAPAGSRLDVALRAEVDGHWTHWWAMGRWSEEATGRTSIAGQEDEDGEVSTDTLILRRPATALQWRVRFDSNRPGLTPQLRGIAVTTWPGAPEHEVARGTAVQDAIAPLDVPEISQMQNREHGWQWCSPTALTMVLSYWYKRTGDPRLAASEAPDATERLAVPGVYDPAYEGTGNWVFNTAFAASHGLDAFVARFDSMDIVKPWLAAGVPLIASVAWEPGHMDGAPISRTSGHLTLIVGLSETGAVIVNEPSADPTAGEPIRRTYRSDQFTRAWQDKSHGTVYVIYPHGMF